MSGPSAPTFVPMSMPPAIGTHLPPVPPPGDEPRIHLGADAGLADLQCALQDADGEAAKGLQVLISTQAAARDVPSAGTGISVGEGADELYAGPTANESPMGTNGVGVKRDRDTTEGDREEGSDSDEEEEGLLAYHPAATLILRNSCVEPSNDEGDAGKTAQGHLFVTTRRVLFLSTDNSDIGSKHDAVIDAGCVVLHALSECEERGWHVYCQLDDAGSPGGGNNGTVIPDEAYVYSASNQGKDACQDLFDAFSALASLNPIYGDDDGDGGGGFAGGGFLGMMAGMGEMMMGGDDLVGEGGVDDADEMICRLGEGINLSGGFGTPAALDAEGDHADVGGATKEERAAMLERLDGMLVVPAEYKIASGGDEEGVENEHAGGQFDDAEESGNELL